MLQQTMEQTCNFYVPPMNLATVSKQLNNYANTTHTCNNQIFKKDSSEKVKHVRRSSPPPRKIVLYPYSLLNMLGWVPLPHIKGCYTLIACFVRFSVHWGALGLVLCGMCREVRHLLQVSTWNHHRWGSSTPTIWSQRECFHYCCSIPAPKCLVIEVCELGLEVLPAGLVDFLIALAPHSISSSKPS